MALTKIEKEAVSRLFTWLLHQENFPRLVVSLLGEDAVKTLLTKGSNKVIAELNAKKASIQADVSGRVVQEIAEIDNEISSWE